MSRFDRGSSSSSISGLLTSASARNILCSSPPDSETEVFAGQAPWHRPPPAHRPRPSSPRDEERLKPHLLPEYARRTSSAHSMLVSLSMVWRCGTYPIFGLPRLGLPPNTFIVSAGRLLQSQKKAEHRGLSGSVRADNRNKLPSLDAEVGIVPHWRLPGIATVRFSALRLSLVFIFIFIAPAHSH